MFWIVLLVIFGVLFLIAELLLLPGLSIGALLALICDAAAAYFAFARYGSTAGWIVVGVIIAVSIVATVVSCRTETWQRLSLHQQITSSSTETPSQLDIRVGDRGVAITRLAPMGKVEIGGKTVEAKTVSAFIDQRSAVEVIGCENFNVIVKRVEEQPSGVRP